MYEIWGGFFIGLLGSLHCVGMCGPIAISLNYPEERLNQLSSILLYNFGRIITYSFFGLLAGFIGRTIFYSGFQQVFSISIGAVVLVYFLIPGSVKSTLLGGKNPLSFFYNKLSGLVTSYGLWNKLVIGVLNGLLPCGLVFLAAANAIVQPRIEYGVLYMFLFGLGTVPLMLVLLLTKSHITGKWKSAFNRLLPIIGITIGVLMILRGMELGIPYLSPVLEHTIDPSATDCN